MDNTYDTYETFDIFFTFVISIILYHSQESSKLFFEHNGYDIQYKKKIFIKPHFTILRCVLCAFSILYFDINFQKILMLCMHIFFRFEYYKHAFKCEIQQNILNEFLMSFYTILDYKVNNIYIIYISLIILFTRKIELDY
jgi:hypothetical protein